MVLVCDVLVWGKVSDVMKIVGEFGDVLFCGLIGGN